MKHLILLTLLIFSGSLRAEFFEIENPDCSASLSKKKISSPRKLQVGEQFYIQGQRVDSVLVLILNSPSSEKYRWVKKDCGKEIPKEEFHLSFKPFFDFEETPMDQTPKPPKRLSLDEKVLNLCGALGKKTKQKDFEKIVGTSPSLTGLIEKTKDFYEIDSREKAIKKLGELWYSSRGFDHIFCGEMDGARLEGLHYGARLEQLQKNGEAGINICSPNQNNVAGYFNVGIVYYNNKGALRTKCRVGYVHNQNAKELLLMGTEFYFKSLNNPPEETRDSGKWVGIYEMEWNKPCFESKIKFKFITGPSGPRTLYPIQQDPDCAHCSMASHEDLSQAVCSQKLSL